LDLNFGDLIRRLSPELGVPYSALIPFEIFSRVSLSGI